MSQFSKKQLLEMVDDLYDGTKSLRDVKEESLSEVWLQNIPMFGQLICMIGDFLLSLEGNYQVSVDCIENYCQNLQQVESNTLERKERVKVSKEMLNLLQKLRFELSKHFPEDKKEMVFFPYLYSMWDSMESVWRAAVESGEYNVFVVPIPYYEKNSDGSFGQMRYEGAEYPAEVQAVAWESYNVAKRKPDIAFIHNPYDDANHISSVHPNYYSFELKNYVKKLVYIPYFVLTDDFCPKHLCVNPAIFYSDLVIVQSENVRNDYVKYLLEFANEGEEKINWTKKSLREKILPLGSPKLDKVKTNQGMEQNIPEKWQEIMMKPDGSGKKVIFYNTTIGAALDYRYDYMEKLRDTLRTFEAEKEEIALLWRPHPLLESTLRAADAKLADIYVEIVQGYQQGNWGIFDDSADFHRAVAISDGYYGDPSSVVKVFEEVKKPVLMQQMRVQNFGRVAGENGI